MATSKKEEKLYIKTGNKVKFLLDREGILQTELCDRLPSKKSKDGYVSTKTLSRIVNGYAKLEEYMAKNIASALSGPDRHYRYTWLLYDDPYMTDEEKDADVQADISIAITRNFETRTEILRAVSTLMALHGVKFIDQEINSFTLPPFDSVASFGGFDFTGMEIERISTKIVEMLGTELKYAVKEKECELTVKAYRTRNR